jgi:hypothetical protein
LECRISHSPLNAPAAFPRPKAIKLPESSLRDSKGEGSPWPWPWGSRSVRATRSTGTNASPTLTGHHQGSILASLARHLELDKMPIEEHDPNRLRRHRKAFRFPHKLACRHSLGSEGIPMQFQIRETCPRCRKPVTVATVELHPTRNDRALQRSPDRQRSIERRRRTCCIWTTATATRFALHHGRTGGVAHSW